MDMIAAATKEMAIVFLPLKPSFFTVLLQKFTLWSSSPFPEERLKRTRPCNEKKVMITFHNFAH